MPHIPAPPQCTTMRHLISEPPEREQCSLFPVAGEEVVRGRPLFAASSLLAALEPMLRGAAGVAPWQVVSQGAGVGAGGKPLAVESLADVQGERMF